MCVYWVCIWFFVWKVFEKLIKYHFMYASVWHFYRTWKWILLKSCTGSSNWFEKNHANFFFFFFALEMYGTSLLPYITMEYICRFCIPYFHCYKSRNKNKYTLCLRAFKMLAKTVEQAWVAYQHNLCICNTWTFSHRLTFDFYHVRSLFYVFHTLHSLRWVTFWFIE